MGVNRLSGASDSRRTTSAMAKQHWPLAVLLAGGILGAGLTGSGFPIEGAAIALMGLAPLVILIERRLMPQMLLGPLVFLCAHEVVHYAIGPLGQIYLVGGLRADPKGFVLAQWGTILGWLCLLAVYPAAFTAVSRRFRARQRTYESLGQEARWNVYAVILTAVSIVIYAMGWAFGLSRLGGTAEEVPIDKVTSFAAFQYVPVPAVFLLAYGAYRQPRRWGLIWAAVTGAFCVMFFLDGGRGFPFWLLLLSACGFSYAGMGKRKIVIAGIIVVSAFVPLAGVVQQYRGEYDRRVDRYSDRISGFRKSWTSFFSAQSGVGATSQIFFERATAQNVDLVFLQTPRPMPYAGFRDCERILYTYIPLVIWPDRPALMDGNDLAIEYGGASFGSKGSYMPATGDGYRRFGWLGILMIYGLVGACLGLLTGLTWSFRHRLEWLAMLTVLITMANGETTFATLLGTSYSVLWVFPKYLCFFWITAVGARLFGERREVRTVRLVPKPAIGWASTFGEIPAGLSHSRPTGPRLH